MRKTFLILAASLLCACNNEQQPKQTVTPVSGVAMTIPYRILVGNTLSLDQQREISSIIKHTFQEVDATYNKFNPDSEISKLNSAGANTVIKISKPMTDIFEAAATVVSLSEGRFDPTIESLQVLWKAHLEQHDRPTKTEISELLPSLGWNHIHYAEGQFWKDFAQTKIDLGGIAKGMCVDQLTERLVEAGYPNVYVEWGGEIRTAGEHPDGRPWRVYISRLGDPNPDSAIATIDLKNQAVATSGDYLQQWSIGDTTYSHIIDPYASSPIEVANKKIASVTVVAPNCTMADALATALMLFPSAQEAKEWAQKLQETSPEISVWIITREAE